MLIADIAEPISPLYHETRGTRLGVGLRDGGRFDAQAVQRTLEAVAAFAERSRERGARISVIATSAMRRADDAAELADEIARIAGTPVNVLSGSEEARYSFVGATYGRDAAMSRVGVLDVGGGSSEYACASPGDTTVMTRSIEIGAVRAGERFPAVLGSHGLDIATATELEASLRAAIRAELLPLSEMAPVTHVYGVGGTVMTAAAILSDRPREEATGVIIERAAMRALATALIAQGRDGRLAWSRMNPQRADILPAGLLVVDEACAALGVDRLESSAGDLLLGYLAENAPI